MDQLIVELVPSLGEPVASPPAPKKEPLLVVQLLQLLVVYAVPSALVPVIVP